MPRGAVAGHVGEHHGRSVERDFQVSWTGRVSRPEPGRAVRRTGKARGTSTARAAGDTAVPAVRTSRCFAYHRPPVARAGTDRRDRPAHRAGPAQRRHPAVRQPPRRAGPPAPGQRGLTHVERERPVPAGETDRSRFAGCAQRRIPGRRTGRLVEEERKVDRCLEVGQPLLFLVRHRGTRSCSARARTAGLRSLAGTP